MVRVKRNNYLTKQIKENLPEYYINGRSREWRNKTDEEKAEWIKEAKRLLRITRKDDKIIKEFMKETNEKLAGLANEEKIKINLNKLDNINKEKRKKAIEALFIEARDIRNKANKRIIFSTNGNNNKFNVLNDNLFNSKFIKNSGFSLAIEPDERAFSDAPEENKNFIEELDEIEFKSFYKTNKNNNREGAFFKYFLNIDLDLKKYQIFNSRYNADFTDNCLIYALRLLGLDKNKLDYIKNYIRGSNIAKCKLEEIAEKLNIRIELIEDREDETNNNIRTTIYNKEAKEIYKLALVDNHYFIYENSGYTKYFIENYHKLANIKNNKIIYRYREGKGYDRDEKRTIDTLKLIKLLLENKEHLLEEINYNNISSFQENLIKVDFIDDLEYNEDLATRPKIKIDNDNNDKKNEKEYLNIFADFETFNEVNEKGQLLHIPYLLCVKYDNEEEIKYYSGFNCAEEFIKELEKREEKHYKLIFHNAKYDYNFIAKLIKIESELNSEGHFKNLIGYTRKGQEIFIKCSYNLFNIALKDCPKAFLSKEEQAKIKKEIMPYELYNRQNINKRYLELNEINEKLFKSVEDYKEFINNCKKWGLYNSVNNKIDIVEYSKIYCFSDVEILNKSYNKFKEWIINDFKINIDNYLTISSIADEYFKINGCYNDIYEVSLNIQKFIMGCIYGGRVMLNSNKKINTLENDKLNNTKTIINDFDAVSLYPSAMRLLEYPKGKPKILKENELNLNFLNSCDAYYIEIKILKVGIKREFPLLCKFADNKRNYINEMEGEIIKVDKIYFEDLINFHKIEYEILRGYYYNDGTNPKIKEVIQYLFNKRKELKKEGNKAEIIYKLLMNSAYGKTIQKQHDKEYKFIYGNDAYKSYISKNYNYITSIYKLDDKEIYKIEVIKNKNNHFNLCHIGSLILSQSKRIMNEIITLAEDNNIFIYYQDTDSIHIKDNEIKLLEKLFKDKYNRELIGSNLGQFHSDFSLNGSSGLVYSVGFIGLGKKCYLDILESKNEKGDLINGFHIRLKGISKEAIDNKLISTDYNNIVDIFNDLYNGKNIEFDLTAEGKKACFKFFKNYDVITQINFKRNIKF